MPGLPDRTDRVNTGHALIAVINVSVPVSEP
jgi:hypothetical protein